MTTRVALYFHPGDDETRVFKYLDTSGAVVSLVGFTASWVGAIGATSFTISGTVDGPSGTVSVRVPRADTTAYAAAGDSGTYTLTVTSSGGDNTTIAEGPLVILGE